MLGLCLETTLEGSKRTLGYYASGEPSVAARSPMLRVTAYILVIWFISEYQVQLDNLHYIIVHLHY